MITKDGIIKDFKIDCIFLTERPFNKNTLIQKHYRTGKGGEERTLTLCFHCGRISYGWGYKCRYCMKDTRVDLSEAYYKIQEYEGGND